MQETASSVQELEWVEQLLHKPLPSVSTTSSILLRLMAENTLSYQKISDILRNDPVLALQLLNNANLRTSGNESLVKTLSQAISLLGMNFLEELLRNTPPPERVATPAVLACNRAVASSFFAAHLCQTMVEQKWPEKGEEYYWHALLYSLPMWLLWRYTPKKMQAWSERLNHSLDYRKVLEERVFGASFPTVWRQIHTGYSLPEGITETPLFDDIRMYRHLVGISACSRDYVHPVKPTDRDQRLLMNHHGFIVAICNLIAFQAERSLYSGTTQRLIRCLSVWAGLSVRQTLTLTHQVAVQSARLHPLQAGNLLPMQLLEGPDLPVEEAASKPQPAQAPTPRPDEPEKQSIAEPEPEPVAATEVAPVEPEAEARTTEEAETEVSVQEPPQQPRPEKANPEPAPMATPDNRQMRRGNQDLYKDITQSMLRTPGQFPDIATLMNGAARCITYGVGLRTCVVALINTQRTRLKGYYAVGTNDRPELARIDLDLTEDSLFSKIMEKPSSIWVRPGSSEKVRRMLPTEFLNTNRNTDFFLTSCFVKTRPVALFYADAGVDALPLSEYEYNSFKYVCGAASQVLLHFSQRNQKKP